jgi:hypothetical protein
VNRYLGKRVWTMATKDDNDDEGAWLEGIVHG